MSKLYDTYLLLKSTEAHSDTTLLFFTHLLLFDGRVDTVGIPIR